ncbi:hypothetical protein ABH935_007035 [Catenulispora sp. GAS73]|uniref:hypothetical protein n=1 Tax=Catenulispora sp. GAS73 TaxID=3156269 RepID=UPI0035160D09
MSTTDTAQAPAPPTGTTAADLIAFWDWALAAGHVRLDTGRGIKNACTRVLSATPAWQNLDVHELDAQQVVAVYAGANVGHVTERTLGIYASTFRRGLRIFRDYLADPDSFDPDLPRHRPWPHRAATQPAGTGSLQIRLARGRTAELTYPADLTPADAATAIHTLRNVLPTLPTTSDAEDES